MAKETYEYNYTSFSGADIVATFNNKVIGELQAISYSVAREKAPIYTMGSPNPRSYSRGKRGIGGAMSFIVFNKDALLDLLNDESSKFYTAYANKALREQWKTLDPDGWEAAFEENGALFTKSAASYIDEIPPFDITITLGNEYGKAASFSLLGVEIVNEGMGFSIDDITTEKAVRFVARDITPLEELDMNKIVKNYGDKDTSK